MSAESNIHSLLESRADGNSSDIALVHGEHHITYSEIEEQANRLANFLLRRELQRGDRVGLLAENGLDYVVGFFGILKAGGCVVALNGANKPRALQRLLADAGAVGLVTHLRHVRRDLPEIVAESGSLQWVVTDRAAPSWSLPPELDLCTAEEVRVVPTTRPQATIDADGLAAILYTSGSTGMPRGATLTHGNLLANTHQILGYLPLTSADSVMVVLPFHYSFGNSLLLTHVKVGGSLVVDNRFAYPQVILSAMQEHEVTGFSGVPSTYAILTAKTEFLQTDLPCLQYLTQAGGAMSPSLTLRLREALPPRIRMYVMYGQTEASARLSYLPPERLEEKLGSIGIPIPGVSLTVRRNNGEECNVEEVGEVVAQGDNIMQGYWNDPDETARVLKPDGLHTGDLGYKDADGYIFLVDRIKNIIKTGAHRVSAREIEETVAELPAVVEVCALGVEDEVLGEAIELFVVTLPQSNLDANSVLHHCLQNLAKFKIPRRVHFLDTLPKNAAGKLVKAELLDRIS